VGEDQTFADRSLARLAGLRLRRWWRSSKQERDLTASD